MTNTRSPEVLAALAEPTDLSAWTPYNESAWAALDGHEHGYLGDEHDGAPYCPVDECGWNAPWEGSYGEDYDGADDER
jgi:hypothetical protein